MKYKGQKTNEIVFPLGGIGTGSIGLRGNGSLSDWQIFNRPDKNSALGYSHFAIKAMKNKKLIDARVLCGDSPKPYINLRYHGIGTAGKDMGMVRNMLGGFPHFEKHIFDGEMPFANITFSHKKFPAKVSLKAFNPFIPQNDYDSSLPAAFFEITVENTTEEPIDYTVSGVISSPYEQNETTTDFFETKSAKGIMISKIDPSPTDGQLCIATDEADFSYQQLMFRGTWFDQLNVYWTEFLRDERFWPRNYGSDYVPPKIIPWTMLDSSLLAVHFTVKPKQKRTVRFLISWYYPIYTNYWNPDKSEPVIENGINIKTQWKNYYATCFEGADKVTEYSFFHWERLKKQSLAFQKAIWSCSLPEYVLDRAISPLSVLKSPTCLRLEDGSFYGWEGCFETEGFCEGSCTHVWGYAYALPFLFPKLERSMHYLHFTKTQDENGALRFRILLPPSHPENTNCETPCADGQMGEVIRAYRDWKISGDDDYLRSIWENVQKALEFAWNKENEMLWDPDKTGVLVGRQHHTLDLEMFGVTSWLSSMYLAALKAASEMADYLGLKDKAREYIEIFERGKNLVKDTLFNGEYFVQKLDLTNKSYPAKYIDDIDNTYWSEELKQVKFQIGEGCLTDQVLGQWHANLCGLGEVLDNAQVISALKSVYKYNFIKNMREYANSCRIYAADDEAGVVICRWPENVERPAIPVPYTDEAMNGFEYGVAVSMMQNGMVDECFEIFKALSKRYDGQRRNPYDEFEAGSYYARSMASFSVFIASSGFTYDMPNKRIGFNPVLNQDHFCGFFSVEGGWGNFITGNHFAKLHLCYGKIMLKAFSLPFINKPKAVLCDGKLVNFKFSDGTLYFDNLICIKKELCIKL